LISDYDAEVVEKGEITISAKKIYEMVREIQGEVINFTKKNNNCKNFVSKGFYKIPGLPAEDFPSIIDDKDIQL